MMQRACNANLNFWIHLKHIHKRRIRLTRDLIFLEYPTMTLQNIPKDTSLTIPPVQYEYLDHTADVQIHSWGKDLKEAFEQCAMGVFGYITDLATVTIRQYADVEVTGGDDEKSMLFRFLDDVLFLFNAEPFLIPKKVEILEMDLTTFTIKARCYGEVFDLDKHPQGTEVKAITYSNMQIHKTPDRVDVYVIIDI